MAKRKNGNAASAYERRKEEARARNARIARAGRDIAPIPEIVDPERRLECERDFQRFCQSYFPEQFPLPFSRDHLKVISKIEAAVLHGGLFAMAMPRGSGKTTLCECASLWAVLYGHRSFVLLVGSSETAALEMLASIKTELETSELLLEDFPESCHPIVALEGIANRCRGQLCNGDRTHIEWTANTIVMPTIAGSAASGAILKVAGITGRIRGMKHKKPDGASIRPDLVIIDDPQTDESAKSVIQCQYRERVLAGAILGLSGPGKKISGIMPCTVIRPGDMADNILDRDKHPEWSGERTKMVYAFPENESLWAEYARIREASLRDGRGLESATEFYRRHQTAMDAGAVVAWPERFNPDEASAIQHAMNLKLQDEAAFFAEYQNDPLADADDGAEDLTADYVMQLTNQHKRGVAPVGCELITCGVDVQKSALYFTVVAWGAGMTGHVIDYGTYPDQRSTYFAHRDIRRTLGRAFPGRSYDEQLAAGLSGLLERLAVEWQRDDGERLYLQRCLIDANWAQSTEMIYTFCRQSDYRAMVVPAHGRYIGAANKPVDEYKVDRGDRAGDGWLMTHGTSRRRKIRHVIFDTNFWKTRLSQRLATAKGAPGSLSFFGESPDRHRMIAEHVTAEYSVRTEGRGRTVDEWKLRPGRDNHLLDCLVMASVAASIEGLSPPGREQTTRAKKRRVSFRELQRKARRRVG